MMLIFCRSTQTVRPRSPSVVIFFCLFLLGRSADIKGTKDIKDPIATDHKIKVTRSDAPSCPGEDVPRGLWDKILGRRGTTPTQQELCGRAPAAWESCISQKENELYERGASFLSVSTTASSSGGTGAGAWFSSPTGSPSVTEIPVYFLGDDGVDPFATVSSSGPSSPCSGAGSPRAAPACSSPGNLTCSSPGNLESENFLDSKAAEVPGDEPAPAPRPTDSKAAEVPGDEPAPVPARPTDSKAAEVPGDEEAPAPLYFLERDHSHCGAVTVVPFQEVEEDPFATSSNSSAPNPSAPSVVSFRPMEAGDYVEPPSGGRTNDEGGTEEARDHSGVGGQDVVVEEQRRRIMEMEAKMLAQETTECSSDESSSEEEHSSEKGPPPATRGRSQTMYGDDFGPLQPLHSAEQALPAPSADAAEQSKLIFDHRDEEDCDEDASSLGSGAESSTLATKLDLAAENARAAERASNGVRGNWGEDSASSKPAEPGPWCIRRARRRAPPRGT